MPKNYEIKLIRPSDNGMCAPGSHVVRGHDRICQSGTKNWVDTHIRKNHGPIPKILLFENIHYLFWGSINSYPKLGKIEGFLENAELDGVILFWLGYWRSQDIEFPRELDPLLVKTIIAIESSFNSRATSTVKNSSATGLMQITDETRRILSGRKKNGYRELKSNYLEISKSDVQDPIVNVAAGTRWLAHKYSIIPKTAEKTLYNTIKMFHSWDSEGDDYAKTVEELYQKSKKLR